MSEKRKTVGVNLQLPVELDNWIVSICAKRLKSKTDFIRDALFAAKEREEEQK